VRLAEAISHVKVSNKAQVADNAFVPKPMTHEEIRLWLQSFNAGPYALLKYQGDVPYTETQNYVPRVLKAYEENLDTPYDAEVAAAAQKYGLDPQMIKAIMKTESDFQNDTVSHAGARGLMQVMPVVWQDIKKKYGFGWDYSSEVFEPSKNIEVACAYLAWLRYDFLPRHFAAFEEHPNGPIALVRDVDLGVPDRETPRLIAKSAGGAPVATVEVASAEPIPSKKPASAVIEDTESKKPAAVSTPDKDVKKTEKSSSSEKSEDKAESEKSSSAKSKVRITDSESNKDSAKTKSANGKTRVTVKASGRAVAISVKNGKVSTMDKKPIETAEGRESLRSKRAELAKVSAAKEKEENQGG